jgi:tetratricopeptide (TPR) repeat protein
MDQLIKKVDELEKKAKAEEEDFKKKAKYHQKAAKIWRKINNRKMKDRNIRNWKWNMANYYYAEGLHYFHSNDYKKAKRCFKIAEKLFLELEIKETALYCGEKYIYASFLKEKEKMPTQSLIELEELFLERYKDFSDHRIYIHREHRHWNSKGKLLRREMKFKEAAQCYKKSVDVISKINKKKAIEYLETYYTCKAVANMNNKKIFEKYINKAIEISRKIGDEKQIFYHLGLKYEIFGLYSSHIEKKIEFFEDSKNNYYKAEERIFAKRAESLYLYSLSQEALKNGKYEKALDLLSKTIKIIKDIKYSNPVPFPYNLESEKYLYSTYLHLSKCEFSRATKTLEKWLDINKEIENTKEYVFNENIKICIDIYNRESFSNNDLQNMEDVLIFVRENDLGQELYSICSLSYTYISLCLHNIKEKKTLRNIRLQSIRKITTEKVAENVKQLMNIRAATEVFDWMQKLPPIFLREFDKYSYSLENTLPDSRSAAVQKFYTILENYLKIIVYFNAKILWNNEWISKLEEYVVNNQKHFKRFTLGDLIRSVRFFKDNNTELCKDIPEEIFKLLDEHMEIRNRLIHDILFKFPETDIRKDFLRIINAFLPIFPTCITVLDTQKSPWYDAEILWNDMPRRISLYSEKKLTKSNYLVEQIWKIEEKKIFPEKIIPIPPIKSIQDIFLKKENTNSS